MAIKLLDSETNILLFPLTEVGIQDGSGEVMFLKELNIERLNLSLNLSVL